MSTTTARKGEWLEAWDPENEATWDSKLAWKTLWITTFCLTLAFIAWFLPSAIIPKLASVGYTFTKGQLYWMAAMPGLAAGLLRIVWMVMPPILGTRKLVTITTLLLIPSTLGWGVRVMEPTAPYWELMVLAFLAGIGGGAFSGLMPSTSYFFPKSKQGTALGLQAGIVYIMTFGTFSGLSAQFGLLMINLYGAGNAEIVSGSGAAAKVIVAGYAVPEAVKFVFLGPLIGAVARFAFSPLTDRMGGAIWTLISGVGLIGSIIYTIPALTPDTSSAAALDAGFNQFLYGMLAIFLFAGIGNASTFKQMPMIFEKRQAGGVIGWTAAIAAFGPFLFGMGINFLGAVPFYWIGVVWAVGCVALTWWRYARKGAPKPS